MPKKRKDAQKRENEILTGGVCRAARIRKKKEWNCIFKKRRKIYSMPEKPGYTGCGLCRKEANRKGKSFRR